jgi:hypothetical protein
VAIVNSIATFNPNASQPPVTRTGVVILTAAPQTVTVPATGSISPAVTRGYGRCKIYNQSVAISVTAIQLNASDGTNTVILATWSPQAALAITATAYCDVSFHYIIDTAPSATAGGATGTLIFGGATTFNFLVFTTGAGGTAAGDFEISAEP